MTSRLVVEQIEGSVGSNNIITVPSGHTFAAPGLVLQCRVVRYDGQATYSTGSGTELIPLWVSITPKKSNSLILCMFQVHGECGSTHDVIYRVYKNGSAPSGPYAGYNTSVGDVAYSCISQALPYEGDYNSTPYTKTFFYHDFPGSIATQTYCPVIKDSYNTSYTWYLNRAVGSPQNGYECGVSFSIAWEIGQ